MQSKTSNSDVRYSQKPRYLRKDKKDDDISNKPQASGLKRSDSQGTLQIECDRMESRNYYTSSSSQRGSRRNSKRANQSHGKHRNARNKHLLPLSDDLLEATKNLIASTAIVKKASAWCSGMPKFGHSEDTAETVCLIDSTEENKASIVSERESEIIEIEFKIGKTQEEKLNSKVSSFIQQPMGDSESTLQIESISDPSEDIETETLRKPILKEYSTAEKPPLPLAKNRAKRKDSKKFSDLKIRTSDLDSKPLPRTPKIAIIYSPSEELKEPAKLLPSFEKPQTPKITIHPPEELTQAQTPLPPQGQIQKTPKDSLRKKTKNQRPKKESIEKLDESSASPLEDPRKEDSHSEHLTNSTTPEFDRSKTLSSDEDGRAQAAEIEAVQVIKIVYNFQTVMNYVKTLKFNKPAKKIKNFCNRHIKTTHSWKPPQNVGNFRRSNSSNSLIEREPEPTLNFRESNEKLGSVCPNSWRIINEEFIKKAKETSAKVQAKPDEVEASRRQIKITLNKLTFDNFDKLKPRLYELSIISDESLNFLVISILNKACTESKFTSLYAKLCSYLLDEYHKFQFSEDSFKSSHSIKNNKFRRALFESCQSLYEYFDEDSSPESSSGDAQYDQALVKKKILGNVRFIGELFREGVILNRIVLECIEDLIDPSIKERRLVDSSKLNLKEGKLEGACILLLTGGACFDKEGIIKDTDRLFKILEDIRTRKDLTTRIKFLIMNVIDARKIGWVEKEQTTVEIKPEEQE